MPELEVSVYGWMAVYVCSTTFNRRAHTHAYMETRSRICVEYAACVYEDKNFVYIFYNFFTKFELNLFILDVHTNYICLSI